MADPLQLDRDDWLAQVNEEIIDPARPIIDPHHHLWSWGGTGDYLLTQLRADTSSGHNVEKTVFVECRADYHHDAPTHLRPVGETAFVAAQAAESRSTPGAQIAGIVAHADLCLDAGLLDEVLDAHVEAGGGLFRGIRHAGASAIDPSSLSIPGRARPGLYGEPEFRAGVAQLGARGLTYDTWHYHHQNAEFLELARAVPDTTMVLDHFGTPLGVGQFEGRRDELFPQWKDDISAIAGCDNVVAKLGGLAMPDNGFAFHHAAAPPTSDALVAAQRRYYDHTIECFGPERCMFESNFPVDRASISYHVLFNALKKIAAPYSAAEQLAMFYGTAARVYRL